MGDLCEIWTSGFGARNSWWGDLHAAFATLDSNIAVLGGVDAQYWDSALRRFGFGIWKYGFAILNSGLVVVQI